MGMTDEGICEPTSPVFDFPCLELYRGWSGFFFFFSFSWLGFIETISVYKVNIRLVC